LVHATDADEIKLLRAQIRALEQRLDDLEKKQELSAAEATAAAQTAPKVSVSDKGFSLASADNANAIRLRALVQVDSRLFFQDGGLVNNSFVLRRARFIAEGTVGKIYDFQLVPEYAGSSVTVLDANLAMTLSPAAQLKFGRFKPPLGLELLQSDASTFFAERSLVTNFLPNRDVGVQLGGNGPGADGALRLRSVSEDSKTTTTHWRQYMAQPQPRRDVRTGWCP